MSNSDMGPLNSLANLFRGSDRPIKRMSDPVFGSIELYSTGTWRAKVLIQPVGREVVVYLWDAEAAGATDFHRQRYLELLRRFSEIEKAAQSPLWNEYESIRKEWGLASRPVNRPAEIWEVAKLSAIGIDGPKSSTGIDFSIHYDIDWENDDHELNVRFKDWQVVEVAMEG